MSDDKDEKKKDLTGILELSSLMPPASAEELLAEDQFQVNTEQSVEQIDDFAELGAMGMMDHAPEELVVQGEEHFAPEPIIQSDHADDLAAATQEPINDSLLENHFTQNFDSFETAASPPSVDEIKNYSERSRETPFQVHEKASFHLWMNGTFDPFARDKLLLFITDNPIGLNSMELDRQLGAGRVMFPRISEFAGIKLIQDLRDADLTFKLVPSPRDEDEILPTADNIRITFDAKTQTLSEPSISILPDEKIDLKLWQAFDTIHLVQFLKAEILEVERSDLFQNLMDRMLVSLKRKAELKGAAALGQVKHELKSLRLPSQYQVELKGTLYKKL